MDAPRKKAELAQLVERNLAKVEVAGSSPVFRSPEHTFAKPLMALKQPLGAFSVTDVLSVTDA